MSNNWRFGKEDVDELLFMLQVTKQKTVPEDHFLIFF